VILLTMHVILSLQAKAPSLGGLAPALGFDRIIGGKASDDFTSNRMMGKVTVVEFSANWCGPFRAGVPHLNAIAEQLKESPIRFVVATAESETASRKFRDETKLAIPMDVSSDGSVFEKFWIGSLPTVIVIGPNARIAARSRPRFPISS
jgi:thiol-disulfide isomerase/thioredoxin